MCIFRSMLFISTLVAFSVLSVGGSAYVPKIEIIEFEETAINASSRGDKCEKYHQKFMRLLHSSLECSEDYGGKPSQSDYCLNLTRLLITYSRLRSKYCYGDDLP